MGEFKITLVMEDTYELIEIIYFRHFGLSEPPAIGKQRKDGMWEFKDGKEYKFALSNDRLKERINEGVIIKR